MAYRAHLSSPMKEDNRKLLRRTTNGDELLHIHLINKDMCVGIVSLLCILATNKEVAADRGKLVRCGDGCDCEARQQRQQHGDRMHSSEVVDRQ